MRHLAPTAVLGLLALFAAPPAWAGGGVGDAADPRYAPSAQATPATASVEPRLDWNAKVPASDAWLTAGACEAPCAPPCAPPAPCGVCRKGFDSCGNPRLGWEIAIGGWLSGLNGSLGVRGRSTDVDVSPADVLDYLSDLDFTILGAVRATYGRWNFRAGLFYMGMGSEFHISSERSVDISFDQWIVEGAVGYRVAELPVGCKPCAPCMAVQPFVGVRYNSLNVTLSDLGLTAPIPDRSQSKSWADLIVGTELIFDFRNQWWARAYGDVGGFGLSGSNDMTWSLRGEVGYMFNEHVGMFLGLLAIGSDYKDGGFTWNLTQWGPYLGVAFSF